MSPPSTALAWQNRPPVLLGLDGPSQVAQRRAADSFRVEQLGRQIGDNEHPLGPLPFTLSTGNQAHPHIEDHLVPQVTISNDMAAVINLSVEETVRRLSIEEMKTQLSPSQNPLPRRRSRNIAIAEILRDIPIVTMAHGDTALNVTYADSSGHQVDVNEGSEQTSEIDSLPRPRTISAIRSPNPGLGAGYSDPPSPEEVIPRLSGDLSTAAGRQVSKWRDLEARARVGKEECGYAGEKFVCYFYVFSSQVYDVLKRLFGSKFNGDNWTSSNRRFAGFPPRNEGLADFRHEDTDNQLSELLELEARSAAMGVRTILIEVKSTSGADTKAFFLSSNQFSLVTLRLIF